MSIILHHSEQPTTQSVQDLNAQYIRDGEFGLPYDFLIRGNGQLCIGPRWLYAQESSQLMLNVPVFRALQNFYHHPAGIGVVQSYHLKAVHITLAGNLNQNDPQPVQLDTLSALIDVLRKGLPQLREILRHSDIEVTSCPGSHFNPKFSYPDIMS